MIVCVQQCAAVEGDREGGLEIGCCCRAIKGGTVLLSAIHSAAYVVYKRRQSGLHEPLGSSKDSHTDCIREKRHRQREPDVQSAGRQEHGRVSKTTSERTISWNVARRELKAVVST